MRPRPHPKPEEAKLRKKKQKKKKKKMDKDFPCPEKCILEGQFDFKRACKMVTIWREECYVVQELTVASTCRFDPDAVPFFVDALRSSKCLSKLTVEADAVFPISLLRVCTSIRRLSLSYGENTAIVLELARVLEDLSRLQNIWFSFSHVKGSDLAQMLAKSSVKILKLTQCSFSPGRSVADLFGSSSGLHEIYIQNSAIPKEAVGEIAVQLSENHNMRRLSLEEVNLSNASVEPLMGAICKSTSMKCFKGDRNWNVTDVLLRSNLYSITIPATEWRYCDQTAAALRSNMTLQDLVLELNDSNWEVFARAIAKNKRLSKVFVKTEQITTFTMFEEIVEKTNGTLTQLFCNKNLWDEKESVLQIRNRKMHARAAVAARAFLMIWRRKENSLLARCVDKGVATMIAKRIWSTRAEIKVWSK